MVAPNEAWQSDAFYDGLDGQTDDRTGLVYIAKGTKPTDSPTLIVWLRRVWHRLSGLMAPWNRGRAVDEGGLNVGVYPCDYRLGGADKSFAGASGVALANNAVSYLYLDAANVLAVSTAGFPADKSTYLPLAVVTTAGGDITAIDDRRTLVALEVPTLTSPDDATLEISAGTLRVKDGGVTDAKLATSYAALAGRAGGQQLRGGTAGGEALVLESTVHAAKGAVRIAPGSDLDLQDNSLVNSAGGAVRLGGAGSAPRIAAMTTAQRNALAPLPGMVIFNTDANQLEVYTTAWGAVGGAGSNIFTTIACPAGGSPVADSPTDTLSLLAGAGLAITGDASTDSVTFALNFGNSAGTVCDGGDARLAIWSRAAGKVQLGTAADKVGLGADPGGYRLLADGPVRINQYLDLPEIVEPAAPGADTGRLFCAVDGTTTKLYFKDQDGTLTDLLAAAGSSGHGLLGASHSDTLAGAPVRGDLLVGHSSAKWARFAKGAANSVLQMNSTGADPEWAATTGSAGPVVRQHHPEITNPGLADGLVLRSTYNYVLTWAAPSALRNLSIADPGADAAFVLTKGAQTLESKTLSAPTLATSLVYSNAFIVRANTADGADNLTLELNGGGGSGSGRGSSITLTGNESAGAGRLDLSTGGAASAQINFQSLGVTKCYVNGTELAPAAAGGFPLGKDGAEWLDLFLYKRTSDPSALSTANGVQLYFFNDGKSKSLKARTSTGVTIIATLS